MRIAVIQLGYDDREPVADRVIRAADLVRAQAGHDLVVLPELWSPGGFSYQSWAERAEPVDGPVASAMSAAARDAGVMLHAGSIIERAVDGPPGPEGKELWNTSLVFAADGSLAATYRKIHRFGFGRGEPLLLEAGNALSLVDVPDSSPTAEPARAALSTCYDLRFPELYRAQLDAGATLFVIPAAWPAARVRHWTLLAHARAIENQCYVLASSQTGTHPPDRSCYGHSMIIDPWGMLIAQVSDGEGVATADLDLSKLVQLRTDLPSLANRRQASYGEAHV